MEKKTKNEKEIGRLTASENKIYYSVLSHFPSTSHDSAMDAALKGGVKFDFIPK